MAGILDPSGERAPVFWLLADLKSTTVYTCQGPHTFCYIRDRSLYVWQKDMLRVYP